MTLKSGLNKVMLIGSLGRDPELRYTPEGLPVTSFSLGIHETWPANGGGEEETIEWFNVVAWRDLAERCETELASGMDVYVEGRLQTRAWEDEAGRQHFMTEVVAANVLRLDELTGADGAAENEG